jgi:gliding motility-associated-like protein
VGINITNIACAGANTGAVNVAVTGGTQPYQYHWSNNNTTEDLIQAVAGFYLLTVTDVNGCSQTANALVSAVSPMVLSAEVDVLVCLNSEGGIDLNVGQGTAPYTYTWSNGATTEDITSAHPGTYHVTVSDANNCKADTSFTIVNLNNFSVAASGGGTIKLGETINLHAASTGSAQTTFSWTPTFGVECPTCADITVQPGQTTLYTVIGVDTNGCQAKDTVSVDVIEDHTIFPPNAFSPNGDGNNDIFQLFGNLGGIKTFNIMIFDRWGEKVFESDAPTFSWDGSYKGELLPPSVCVYVMKAVFLDGHNEKIYKGSITILR